MALTKIQKKKIIEDLREKIERQKIMFFVNIMGLKVKELFDLRKKLKNIDTQLLVAKKTLVNLVLKEKRLEIDLKKMEGEIALVIGYSDIILPAKTIWQFSEEYPNLKILAGILDHNFISAEKIIELAKLPTKKELLTKIVGSIKTPIINFVNVLAGNIKGLINVLARAKT